jgi:hypothetical protein
MKDCETSYRKDCYLKEEAVTTPQKVTFCKPTLKRDCDRSGPVICTTEYETGRIIAKNRRKYLKLIDMA